MSKTMIRIPDLLAEAEDRWAAIGRDIRSRQYGPEFVFTDAGDPPVARPRAHVNLSGWPLTGSEIRLLNDWQGRRAAVDGPSVLRLVSTLCQRTNLPITLHRGRW